MSSEFFRYGGESRGGVGRRGKGDVGFDGDF